MNRCIISWWTLIFVHVLFTTRAPADKIGGMDRAVAEAWWAFQPLPPADAKPSSGRIDAFIDQALAENRLTPNPPADPRTVIRRLHYGLTGLPPSEADVAAFAADPSAQAFDKIVDRLLASPEYGVHWGRHWLDLVRYADTAGENTDRPLPHAWRYRNWVFEAFNRDLAYDDFVRMQLAGDLIGGDREGIIATGYLAIARRFGHDIDQDIHLMHEDVIDNLGKTFLGLTVSCARCHDHKYDPVTARDYYALYGIFSSTRFSYSGCEKNGKPRDLVPLMQPSELDALLKPWQERQTKIDALKEERRDRVNPAIAQAKEIIGTSMRVLAKSQVDEGKSVDFTQTDPITVRKGEVIQLTVLPNGNHGADSTLIEWAMSPVDAKIMLWNLKELLDTFTQSNPHPGKGDADWYFLEPTEAGPVLLPDRSEALDGRKELKKWSLGDLPSVFVNTAHEPIKVWTTLPPRTVFVHPAPNRPVAVAWVSPSDGEVSIRGRVADAHPSGGDGVSFRLEHFADPGMGAVLADLAEDLKPLIENTPRPEIPVAYAVKEAESKHARIHLRGEPNDLGDEVPRAWLSILGGMPVSEGAGSGRRELGEWIVQHPLTARVMVNRIWQGHFGEGLVRSPNDFGARGERPTHPELLDWLAAHFVASGYSVKAMHRLILGTEAYRRSSARAHPSDPDNRWLARFSLRRITAEELRDSLLHLSGNLDRTPGATHPFPPEDKWNYTQHNPFVAVYDTNKRSAYLMVQRQRSHPFLSLFDGADPNASTAGREVTTVPTQALYFLNDPFFHAQAGRVGEQLIALPDAERLSHACRLIFQRAATPTDQEQAKRFFAAYPGDDRKKWSAYARVLLASNEFITVD